jgi:nucleotide-binding universal stress UspA family protein
MITLKSILVATDFSEPADAALTYGRALARNFSATLHLLHVVGDLTRIAYGADGYVTALPDIQREVEDAARKQLDHLLVDNDERPLATRRVIITSNAPALAVVEYAGRENIDLIVTGTTEYCWCGSWSSYSRMIGFNASMADGFTCPMTSSTRFTTLEWASSR